jgi:PD-(D/E)XK nuclease superfamily protein
MSQKILSIDSQILNTYQSCARKCNYSFVQNLHPPDKEEALERGDLMHKMLEVYYSLYLNEIDLNTPVWKEVIEAGIQFDIEKNHSSIRDLSIAIGRYFSTKMSLPFEEIEETIFQFREYCNYYEHDSWNPLAVEQVGSKILFENEDFKFIYNFKVDLVAEQGKIVAPFDHKTSRRRSEPSSLSNQFIGYCYGLGLNNIVVNKIGFQKSLSPQQRFNRFILTIDDARINEWIENTIHWCMRIIESEETDSWPMNLTSCDKYSGCIFAPLCETDPETRLYKIERDFKVEKPWDVARELEGKI